MPMMFAMIWIMMMSMVIMMIMITKMNTVVGGRIGVSDQRLLTGSPGAGAGGQAGKRKGKWERNREREK